MVLNRPFLTMMMWALLLVAPFSSYSNQNGESSFVRFSTQENHVFIDYYLDEQGQVLENIVGALKAGESLRISYLAEIREPAGWVRRGKLLGRALTFHFMSYDPIANAYSLRQNLNSPVRYNLTRKDVEQILFRQYDLFLVEAEKLNSKHEYPIAILISFDSMRDEESLLNFLALKPLWQRQKLEAEVTYIAP